MNTHSTLDRRELLKRVAYLMGGAISTPAMLGVLQGCSAKDPGPGWKPTFLSDAQAALVSDVVDIMIPRTDTPGAKDVGVPAFIDIMLRDTYPKKDQERYLTGLEAFAAHAKNVHGKPFVELDSAQQEALVRAAHTAALLEMRADTSPGRRNRRPFILMTKELAMLGFFTSEVGATQVLQYVAVPGRYRSCIPVSEAGNGKACAEETVTVF